MKIDTEKQNELKAEQVKKIATEEQLKVIEDMQAGTEYLFLKNLGNKPITKETIDSTLQVMVNSVEGDVSQLEEEHVAYAKRKGWLDGFESN